MPRQPHPFTFMCNRCSWTKTTIPLSDALVIGRDWFAQCPKCGNESLKHVPASQREILKARLEQFFRLHS
ncbi:hypothetical protein M8P87_09690 [Pseudomonas stutzeri]|nr:hypothetical protein [Stutzerimonas stutzeri]MCQ4230125.1 hypothetical protein [Stutzerimonas stutzeri]MCW8163308.1 hypothetical protein [Stutzerimonas stutzeri]MDH0081523.1 hypothetical protein [Stutzerimonas stutzeri]OWG39414.1 hypothetical protein CAQ69_04660 [Stutzerimonas stutzeri]